MDTIKQAVQEVVNEIYSEAGEVRPSVLLDRAAPPDSPIHNAFEWEDSKAGHEYRLMQARYWIRHVKVVVEDRQERLIHVPKIIVDKPSDAIESRENYYKPVSVVCANRDEFKYALSETLARLNAAQKAFDELKEVSKPVKIKVEKDFKKADKGFDMVRSVLTHFDERPQLPA